MSRDRIGQHKTQSSVGMTLMAVAAAWETARVNVSKALLRSAMSHAFLKCCLSNNIEVSIASVFLHAVSIFYKPSAVAGKNRLRSYYDRNIYIFFFHFH